MLQVSSLIVVGAGGVFFHATAALGKLIKVGKLMVIDPGVVALNHIRQYPWTLGEVPKAWAGVVHAATFMEISSDPKPLSMPFADATGMAVTNAAQTPGVVVWLCLTDSKLSRLQVLQEMERLAGTIDNRMYFVSAGNDSRSGWAAWKRSRRHMPVKGERQWMGAMADVIANEPNEVRGGAVACGGAQTLVANMMTAVLLGKAFADIEAEEGPQGYGSKSKLYFWSADERGEVRTFTDERHFNE